ncbi:MAG: hypothetical protein F6K40_00790 [Okeania sp. SIO3I5]|uniref:tubulin-like doman-containing protein n=1 Tax=Okeania sp. SIO3I5 TaxID=2607805 RepID=UPI0013BDDE1B|nr:tubulin-like doman-containing protein [Okeania sp. SIO3I5]NEQ34921.1 hypothetical protein [Okeania sp. SIO3I5]
MVQSTSKERQSRGINRTICIGIGGTGRDILMRIRRLIVDSYGDLEKLPIVSFVHIDTDKSASQISGLRTGSTYHGVDLSFKESEKVSATMSSRDVDNFTQELERPSTSERTGPYDHIRRWFPPQLNRNIKAIEEGAKGIRPIGRLAFFHNYRKIQKAIEIAEQKTRGNEGILLKAGLRVDAGVNIFIVGSLCGGTGSGMFLDVAYSLRHTYGKQNTKIVGYLVISPELYGNNANMKANTYAALKELNHYTTPGTKFEACYDIQDLVIVEEERPPYDYAYLVSNETAGGYKILEQRKLCNVIARKIALDFSGELAPVVKGMRDNFLQHLIQYDSHPRPNIQRYLTFGMAAIYFPRDRIVQIALNRISLNLVDFWLNGEGQSPDPVLLLERFLLQFRWHDDLQKRDGLSRRLAESVEEYNKNFKSTIDAWRNKLDKAISESQNKDDRIALPQQLPREFREQFRKVIPGTTDSSRGVWLTRLQQICPKITADFQQNIDSFILDLLSPSNENFSIRSSREWLEAIKNELNNYQREIEEQIVDFNGSKTLEDLERKWQDGEQIIADIENKFELPLLGGKNREFQAEAKRIVRQICDLIKHNFHLVVFQETLEIVRDLQNHVENIANQLREFSNLINNLKSDYEKEQADLKQLDFDEMSGEAIFAEEDINNCSQILLPPEELKSQLVRLSSEITKPSGDGKSIAIFLREKVREEEQAKQEINLTVDRLFGVRSTNIVNSVIKRFLQNYSSTERSDRFKQIMQEAKSLLPLDFNAPYFKDDDSKCSQLIGFKDTDDQEVKQFKNILVQDLGIKDHTLKPTQAEDQILIVKEYAGFPLRLIANIEKMRNIYIREMNSPTSFLHNHNWIFFADIIPPDAAIIEELEDIFYPCLALELIQKNGDKFEFPYYNDMRDAYYTAELSSFWNQALEKLANRQDMTEALKSILDREVEKIDEQLWENHYLPKLQKFVKQIDNLPEDDLNYPYKDTVVGTPPTTENPGKEGVINRFRRRIQEKVKNVQLLQSKSTVRKENQEVIKDEIIDIDDDYYFEKSPNYRDNQQTSGDDLMEKLKDLERMKEKGTLTDAEFEAAKKKILGI